MMVRQPAPNFGAIHSPGSDEHLTGRLIVPYPPQEQDNATIDELTLMALHNNAQVELAHGSAAMQLRREGGIAARLYYTIQT